MRQWTADDHDRGPSPEFLKGGGKKTHFPYEERDPESTLTEFPASPTRARVIMDSRIGEFREDADFALVAQRNRFVRTLEMLRKISKYWVVVWHGDLVTIGLARTRQQRDRVQSYHNPVSFSELCANFEGRVVRLDRLFEVAARARGVQEVLDRI